MKTKILLSIITLFTLVAQAQWNQENRSRGINRNIGSVYGKVVDENNKAVAFATVEALSMKYDSLTQSNTENLINGQITGDEGEFDIDQLPTSNEITLRISFLGYGTVTKKVSFTKPGENSASPEQQATMPRERTQGQSGNNTFSMDAMKERFRMNVGDLQLAVESTALDEIVVTGEATSVVLAIDRKIFRVDKDASAAGGTAEDALKNVPTLSVDLDGNLSLRNGAPQLFVDGRPTTLQLNQIAADAIESVEVITNPSAKYDASGGQSGIVNIVLKKEHRIGYHGNLRVGTDTQGGANAGANINLREGKVNVFLSSNFNLRNNTIESTTTRQNLFGSPLTNVYQNGNSAFNGLFGNARTGVDLFLDDYNTITFQGSFTRGKFQPEETMNIVTDSLFSSGISSSEYIRTVDSQRDFKNLGSSILWKRLFEKKGMEWTADIHYNSISFDNDGDYTTNYLTSNRTSLENQSGNGGTDIITFQTDFVNPLSDKIKFETGVRASVRKVDNNNLRSRYDELNQIWEPITSFADQYSFDDQVYAAYASITQQSKNWGYMAGLRVESSKYSGTLAGESTFSNEYPISLFPSLFITRKLNDEDNLQLSYTRRINRPNFFQMMPFTDFSDSLNLSKGNPDLLPEFTNSLELSYQNIFTSGDNIIISAYYKQASDLITAYQYTEADENSGKELIVSTFDNSNSSVAYGMEFTMRNTLLSKTELTSNVNLYNSKIDASNVDKDLVNEQFTWFVKENLTTKVASDFSIQLSGEYRSKTAFTPTDGNSRFRGFGRAQNSAQGYALSNFFVDLSLRKDLMNRQASLTLSVQDIFGTRKSGTYSESDLFIQSSSRMWNPRTVRLNFSYRFGKSDASLFKRKNNKTDSGGNEMMEG